MSIDGQRVRGLHRSGCVPGGRPCGVLCDLYSDVPSNDRASHSRHVTMLPEHFHVAHRSFLHRILTLMTISARLQRYGYRQK